MHHFRFHHSRTATALRLAAAVAISAGLTAGVAGSFEPPDAEGWLARATARPASAVAAHGTPATLASTAVALGLPARPAAGPVTQ